MQRSIGYARVSSTDQDLTIQRNALASAGCVTVFEEKQSGTARENRSQLASALSCLLAGDELVVTRLDRLGRSMLDLASMAHELQQKGAHLRVLEQPVDTSTSTGRAFFGMLAVFAEFETSIRKERQAEGIAKAKAEGVYKGRPPSIQPALVAQLRDLGFNPTQIARKLGISTASVYRALKPQGVLS